MQEFKNHRAAILRMRICPTLFPRARVTDARSGRLALCEVSDRRLLRAEIELCFFVVFTVMFAVYPLLLLRSIATTSWSGLRMSRRAGRLRGRAADANEQNIDSNEEASSVGPSEKRDSELPAKAPPDNPPTVPLSDIQERGGEKPTTDESQRDVPLSEAMIGTPEECEIEKVTPLKMSVPGFKSEKCKSKGKAPKKGVLVSKFMGVEEELEAYGAMPTVRDINAIFALPDDDQIHPLSIATKSPRPKKDKQRVSSVGFTMSKEGKRKADVFWMTLPLIEREYYAHEFKTGNREGGWGMLFKEETNTTPVLKRYPGSLDLNQNQCGRALPYEEPQLRLEDPKNDASLVCIEEVSRQYIVTQAPLAHNEVDLFWQMVWEQHSVGIVMLCKCAEGDMELSAQYWHIVEDDPLIAGSFVVECINSEWSESYCISRLRLHNLEVDESFELLHFHYFAWPEFGGVPEDPQTFAEFLVVVRESGVMQPGVGPPIVHSTTGTGHSGVFVLSDVALSWIEGARGVGTVEIGTLLSRLRQQRPGLVKTDQELRLAYITILDTAHYGLGLGSGTKQLQRDMDNFIDSLINEEMSREQQRWSCVSQTTNHGPEVYSEPRLRPSTRRSGKNQSLLPNDSLYLRSQPSSPRGPLGMGKSHAAPFVELTPEDLRIFLQPHADYQTAADNKPHETGTDQQTKLELPAMPEYHSTAYDREEVVGGSSEEKESSEFDFMTEPLQENVAEDTPEQPTQTVGDQELLQVAVEENTGNPQAVAGVEADTGAEESDMVEPQTAEVKETVITTPENVSAAEDELVLTEAGEAVDDETTAKPQNTEAAVDGDPVSMPPVSAETASEWQHEPQADTLATPQHDDPVTVAEQQIALPRRVMVEPYLPSDPSTEDETTLRQASELPEVSVVAEASTEATSDTLVTESVTQLLRYAQLVVVEDTSQSKQQRMGTVTETELPIPLAVEHALVLEDVTAAELEDCTPTETKPRKRRKKSWFKRLRQALFSCTRANRD